LNLQIEPCRIKQKAPVAIPKTFGLPFPIPIQPTRIFTDHLLITNQRFVARPTGYESVVQIGRELAG
jgi:hypothetical protein